MREKRPQLLVRLSVALGGTCLLSGLIPARVWAAPPEVPAPAGANLSLPQALSLEPQAPASSDPIEVSRWIFPPGQDVVFRAKVTLSAGETGNTLFWKARDAFDVVIAQGQQKVADTPGEKNFEIRIPTPAKGVLYLTATLQNTQNAVVAESESRAVVWTPRQNPVPMKPFLWGVGAHLGRANTRDMEASVALMRMIGFAVSRSDMSWNDIQPKEGVWNWEKHDRIYAALEREHVAPSAVLAYGTRWATTGDPNSKDWHQWGNTPPKTEAFVQYAREAVKRYGRTTRIWEVWNEPDISFWLGTPKQYVDLMNAVVPAIKELQPDAIIQNGGFTNTNRNPDFIPSYLNTIKARPDVFAFHTHMQFENMLRAEAGMNAHLQKAGWTGDKRPPLWLNESGFSSVKGKTEREQASQLVKKMTYAAGTGLGAFFLYDLRDDGTAETNIEHHFGLVRPDFSPKASLVAVNELLNNLGGRRFDTRLSVGKDSYVFVHRGVGSTVLTAWRQTQGRADSGTPLAFKIKLPQGASTKLERHDIWGNVTPLAPQNGVCFLTIGDVPQYIVANSEEAQFDLATQSGQLIDFPTHQVQAPGEPLRYPVQISNPFATPLRGNLKVGSSPVVPFEVAPSSTKAYEVMVTHQAKSGARTKIPVTLTSPELPQAFQGMSEIQTAYAIPSSPQFLTLTPPPSGLVSRFEATPMQDLHFKDAADLSASAQLQTTAEGVKVRIVVNDQTHFASEKPGSWWQGDSIQWALGMPDGKMWEWTAALLPTGSQMALSLAPDAKVGATAPVSIRRDGAQTIYEWTLPPTLPDGTPLPDRFGFNFLVNDNDGSDRKGWLELAAGIGSEKTPAAFVPVAVSH